jgi:uncharacterized protein
MTLRVVIDTNIWIRMDNDLRADDDLRAIMATYGIQLLGVESFLTYLEAESESE